MKKLLLTFWVLPISLFSQVPDTCKLGVYITSIYDLNMAESSFKADFWMWFNYSDTTKGYENTTEVMNSKNHEFSLTDSEVIDSINWATTKVKAELKQSWDVKNFPFEHQDLNIIIEDANNDSELLVFIADSLNSKYNKNIQLDGWKIDSFSIQSSNTTYETSYGNPSLSGNSEYSRIVATFRLSRDSVGLFLKLFTGVYVAFIISMLVFFIDPIFVDPRFGLSVGALFAAVGNKYIVDSIMPETTDFTLVDKIHSVTFMFIFLSVLISVISLNIYKKDLHKKSKKLDRISFGIITSGYVLLNVMFIVDALKS